MTWRLLVAEQKIKEQTCICHVEQWPSLQVSIHCCLQLGGHDRLGVVHPKNILFDATSAYASSPHSSSLTWYDGSVDGSSRSRWGLRWSSCSKWGLRGCCCSRQGVRGHPHNRQAQHSCSLQHPCSSRTLLGWVLMIKNDEVQVEMVKYR